MELITLLDTNWLNFVIIFALSFLWFFNRKRSPNQYLDNIIIYADILEKTPKPKYQKDYLNNIKSKLLWDKVCFYQTGDMNKERIAISLINADIKNIINLLQLNSLIQYFCIRQNKITAVNPFLVKEVILLCVGFILAFIMVISNLDTVFRSNSMINIIIAAITIFIILLIATQFAIAPLKRLNTYRLILKDDTFLKRANDQLVRIIQESNNSNPSFEKSIMSKEESHQS